MWVGEGSGNLDGMAKIKCFDNVSDLCNSDSNFHFQTNFELSCLNFCVSSPPTMTSLEGTREGSYFPVILNTMKTLSRADIAGKT